MTQLFMLNCLCLNVFREAVLNNVCSIMLRVYILYIKRGAQCIPNAQKQSVFCPFDNGSTVFPCMPLNMMQTIEV